MEERSVTLDSASEAKPMTFAELARRLGGELAGLQEDFVIRGLSTVEEAGLGEVSFVGSTRFLPEARASKASGLLVTGKTVIADRPCLVLDNVWKGMLFLLSHFYPSPRPEAFVHPTAVIGSNVSMGKDVWIGPCVVIEDSAVIGDRVRINAQCFIGRGVRIGDDCLLDPQVCILHGCEIGRRVILHPGVVIGTDGFKYELIDGQLTKIPQVGRVVLEDDVELGANTCIDRASLTETRIGRGVKMDNLVQVGHNVSVGKGSVFCAQAGVAGSTRIGENVFMGGQAGVADNLQVGDRAKLGAQAGVKGNVPSDVYYLGAPAMPAKHFMRICADWNHLSEMRHKIREIEQKLAALGEKQ